MYCDGNSNTDGISRLIPAVVWTVGVVDGGGEGYVVIYLGMRGYERNCFTSVQCSNLCGMRTILAYIAPTCMYATQGITRTLPDRE